MNHTYVPGVGLVRWEGKSIVQVATLLGPRIRDIVPITRDYMRTVLGVANPGFLSEEWDALLVLASQYHPRATSEDDAYVDDLLLDVIQNYAPVRLVPRV